MCDITLIVSPRMIDQVRPLLPQLGRAMIEAAETAWPILAKKSDRDFKVIVPEFDLDTVDVEIRPSYEVGEGAYEEGVIFRPTKDEQRRLTEALEGVLVRILAGKIHTYFTWVREYVGTFHQAEI